MTAFCLFCFVTLIYSCSLRDDQLSAFRAGMLVTVRLQDQQGPFRNPECLLPPRFSYLAVFTDQSFLILKTLPFKH